MVKPAEKVPTRSARHYPRMSANNDQHLQMVQQSDDCDGGDNNREPPVPVIPPSISLAFESSQCESFRREFFPCEIFPCDCPFGNPGNPAFKWLSEAESCGSAGKLLIVHPLDGVCQQGKTRDSIRYGNEKQNKRPMEFPTFAPTAATVVQVSSHGGQQRDCFCRC